MEFLAITFIAAALFATVALFAAMSQAPSHRGPTVAEIQARVANERRTFVPLRRW